jgi:alkanesulfonate monooxygenase SsuD/methylene tetrahydromethanopterin reductase-like flavin-dependent oxidoreductase (luciferase family)
LEFGLFVQGYVPGPNAHDSEHEHTALVREMELVQAADRYGWKFAWLTEHHGLAEYSHLSANEVHAGYLAASTERIHIGSGIFNISPRVNHPVKVAEKVATLDHLTNRRFEFGTGRGSGSHEVATFNIADKDSTRAEYDEVIREIDRMWEQKDYTFHGEHFAIDTPHNVLPKPYAPGHPPFWLAVGSPPTWRKAGLLGVGALGFTFSAVSELEPRIADYKAGIAECADPVGQFVNDNAMVTSGVRCAADRERARAQATRVDSSYLATMVSLYHDTMPRPDIPAWPNPPTRLVDDDLDALIEGGYMLCGTPEDICEQLQAYTRIGIDQLCFGVPNGSSYEETLEMIELFGKHVIPEFDAAPDVISTDAYRARAVPKYPSFNHPPETIETVWTGAREGNGTPTG